MNKYHILRKTCCFIIFGAAACATTIAVAAEQDAAGQTSESGTGGGSFGVGDIIVTAQRRAENLQEVPVTVAAFDDSVLQSANITTSTELNKVVPGLSITPNSQSVLLYLRGIGSNVTAIGSEASVAFYVDGVYYSRLTPGLVRLNNIERVEVLKGPQGTLYGRNATGGLVNIITRTPKPGAEPTANISFGYGNYETIDATAYASFSLGEKVAMDISGVIHSQGEGFGKNINNGKDVNKDTTRAVRSKLVFDPGPDTRFILTGEYNQYRGDFSQNSHFRGNRQGFMDGSGVLPTLGFYDVNNDWTNEGTGRAWGATLRIEQDIGFADLSNTLAYHNLKQRNPFDVDLSPANIQHTDLYSYGKEVLNDFQLASKSGSLVDWNVGLFYTDQKQGYSPAVIGKAVPVPGFSEPLDLLVHSNSRVRSLAAYGQARFPIIDRLKGTIGLRWTRDKLYGNGFADLGTGGTVMVPNGIPFSEATETFKKMTFKFVLDYALTDDIFAYASFSRGFKGATFNVIPFNPTPTRPETLDAYEAGLKTEFWDNKVRLNLAGFYYELKNPQVIVIPNSGAITTENAGAAEVKGFEFDLTMAPVRGFNIRAAGTYLDTQYTDYPNAAFYTPDPSPPFGNLLPEARSAKGNHLPYAPKWSANIGGDYTLDMADGSSFQLGANLTYSSSTFFHPDNRLRQNNLTLVDAFAQYHFGDSGLSMKIWGQNLTNRDYCTGAVQFGNPAGDLCLTGSPRTYGATLRFEY
ncbi:MAG: TonB-dependent receptor [Sphingobium sp.]